MTLLSVLTVSAAALGVIIIVVMAAIPFLTDEPWDRGAPGRITGGHPSA